MAKEFKGDVGLYLSGCQVRIPACGIYVVQPTIKEIVQFGENNFMTAVKMFSSIEDFAKSIKEGNSVLINTPDFQIFIETLRDEKGQVRHLADAFFELCCPSFKIEYAANAINFKITSEDGGKDMLVGVLNAFNFQEFGTVINELFLPQEENQEIEYHIDEKDARSKQLLAKIKRNREKLAKATARKDGKNLSLFGLYTSILSIGLPADINTLYSYTPFQIYDAFKRYLAKYQRDRYEALLMVPFADTSKIQDNEPDSWFENLYKPKDEVYNSLSGMNSLNNGVR